jgi:hypothetical protein
VEENSSGGEAAARVLKLAARGELGLEFDRCLSRCVDPRLGLELWPHHIGRLTLGSISPARGPLNAYADAPRRAKTNRTEITLY